MQPLHVPPVHRQFWENWEQNKQSYVDLYAGGHHSFLPNLLPEQAVQLRAGETLDILQRRLGSKLDQAVSHADPEVDASQAPSEIQSPVRNRADGGWLKQCNMVGVNVRTIGSFWNVVKYALTIPNVQDAIHLLPIWEPGVVGSLYGVSSWQINIEFFSQELMGVLPELDSVEKQLKATINLLHALGKSVGMDVIPHTDRFSEITLANPAYFEWLQREGAEIVDHQAELHVEVEARIMAFLEAMGPAIPGDAFPTRGKGFFSAAYPEEQRRRILFGLGEDLEGRTRRRGDLVRYLHAYGFEPVPATMAPPFRGIRVDPDSSYVDSYDLVWYDYQITDPQSMSRVFGPLARYKLYERQDDNADWAIDFERPREEVWRYICDKYAEVQRRYGFDFMRGDMSHVQMRPGGVPQTIGPYYDLLRAVKLHVQRDKGVSHFGYFAETFLAPRDIMVYGDEVDHLEASEADTTLGDLQSTTMGTGEFLQRFRWYRDLLETRRVAPTFAVITGDKDDPRFDEFYRRGSALRLFMALFLTDMPSYMALGFETRDIHFQPADNEHYTKLYVFQETSGPKATSGPFRWGRNGAQFQTLTRIRLYAEAIWPQIAGRRIQWLIAPDATAASKHMAWTHWDGSRPAYVFLANSDTDRGVCSFNLPRIRGLAEGAKLAFEFSTGRHLRNSDRMLSDMGYGYKVSELKPGEGRVYRVAYADPSTPDAFDPEGITP
jgi:hypothetical protein